MPELAGTIIKVYTQKTFRAWVHTTLSKKMGVWRPAGLTLHNTGPQPSWKLDIDDKRAIQLVKNASVTWNTAGWKSGPHLYVDPVGRIITVSPLWARGTHSPSFNAAYWGLELVGDFRTQELPAAQRIAAVAAIAALFEMLGREPDSKTFVFHKEDPKTSHKQCPGEKIGTKDRWLKEIQAATVFSNSGDLGHLS
jgi:hypothetical protein